MESRFVYRCRPWWLSAVAVGGAVSALALAVWLVFTGFALVTFTWLVAIAFGTWLYGFVWSYEVTVDDDTVTMRGMLRERTWPLTEVTGVHYFGSGVAVRFGRRSERVIRSGDSADGLVAQLRQRVPGLSRSLAPPNRGRSKRSD